MSLPTNRIKKIKLADATEYEIIPERLQNSGFSASLPTLTADDTLVVQSDMKNSTVYNAGALSTVDGNTTSGSYKSVRWYNFGINGITTPYDGMKIMIKIPLVGVATAGVILSINGNNASEYHPVAYNVSTVLTTHFPVNSYKVFTYDANATMACYKTSGTSTTVTGVWKGESNYNADTTMAYGSLAYYLRPYTSQALYRYKLCMLDKDNKLVPVTTDNVIGSYSSSTSYSVGQIVYYSGKIYKCIQAGKGKAPDTQTTYWGVITPTATDKAFRPDKIYWYNTTTTIAANSAVGGNTLMYVGYNATNMVISNFNGDIAAYRLVYLCGTYNTQTGLFTLDGGGSAGTSYYTIAPTNTLNVNLADYFTSGKDYILVGGTYSSANYLHLSGTNTMYHFDGTNLVPYDTYHINSFTPTVDQSYNPTSSNAQSGTAVYEAISPVAELAEGKTATYIIDAQSDITGTKDAFSEYTNVTAITGVTLTDLRLGDVILIKALNVPDYWVSQISPSISLNKMETTKVTVPTSVNGMSGGTISSSTTIQGDMISNYVKIASIGHETTSSYDKHLTLSSTNYVRYRTTAELASDLGIPSTYVTSVNGESGAVTLTASDVGALPDDTPIPTNYVTTDTAQTVSGTKTLTGGLKVSGRCVGSGDDEGIVVGPAPNSYAGLICGSPSGRRAVFYLKPSSNAGYNSVWRYNNGSTTYDIAHPEKAGIIALLDDIPNDGVVNATASTNVKRDSSGNVNAVAFDLCTASTSTVNAKMSYDSTNECIKFTF